MSNHYQLILEQKQNIKDILDKKKEVKSPEFFLVFLSQLHFYVAYSVKVTIQIIVISIFWLWHISCFILQILPDMESQVKDLEDKYKDIAQLKEIREKVKKLKEECVWAHVRDKRNVCILILLDPFNQASVLFAFVFQSTFCAIISKVCLFSFFT